MSASLIKHYFPEISNVQMSQLEQLQELYDFWNHQINVISRKDIDELYIRHVLHSLSIAKFIQFNPKSKILDIGTGGGFPGIPLAIMFPKSTFRLVDSVGKKIKVVNEIISSLNLNNAFGENQRAEIFSEQVDFVVVRAVAKSKQIWNWTHQKISQNSTNSIDNGIIALKGGDLDEELKELKRPYQITEVSDYFDEMFFHTKKIVYIPA